MTININEIGNINIKGVIHVGAHKGQELKDYHNYGINNLILFEPLQNIYKRLLKNIKKIYDKNLENIWTFNMALGNCSGYKDINVSYRNGKISLSSSLLQPKKHLVKHPKVKFLTTESVIIDKLDNIIKRNSIDINKFNFMSIDVQGYELEVLKGSVDTLKYVDSMLCEINRDETYENCVQIEELDLFLKDYGFMRKITKWHNNLWGDAFYIKRKINE